MIVRHFVAVEAAGTDASVPAASGARQFWRRLRAQRAALVAAAVVALLVLVALAAPLLTAIEGQDPTTLPPLPGGLRARGRAHRVARRDRAPTTGSASNRRPAATCSHGWCTAPACRWASRWRRPSSRCCIGVVLGVVAAALGNRWVDQPLSRITDIIVAMPLMVMALALLAIVPVELPAARPGRPRHRADLRLGQRSPRSCAPRRSPSRSSTTSPPPGSAAGAPARIARRELLPGLAAPVITYAALLVPTNITVEAALSFLGVGVKPPTPSWGQMLTAADVWYQAAPQYLLLPAGALFVTVLALTVLGDGVRTALDPRAASRLRIGTGRKQEAKAARGGAA